MESQRSKRPQGLLITGLIRTILGLAIIGAFLFACAGTTAYWNGWVYLVALAACLAGVGCYLYRNDKELLKKRLQTKEKEKAQIVYVVMASLSFPATLILCGLDRRYGWSQMPAFAVILALLGMLAGFALFVVTLAQNRFASRVVEVQEGQSVIDTGVYAVIRHPLYTAALLICFSTPLVLGSYMAVAAMVPYLAGIVMRIRNEEKVLREGLAGYPEYLQKVKYRLIPFVW